jgi:phage protein D/phage baseplate assembly protein gpV
VSTFTLQTSIQVDGAPLDPAAEGLLETVLVDDHLHAPDMFLLVFRDPEHRALELSRLTIGSKVRIATSALGGTAAQTLMVGEVTALEGEYTAAGSRVAVRGYDPSHRLHRGRRTRTFVQMKDSDIVRQLAQELGLATGAVEDSGPVLERVSQVNATDWEFLSARARAIGFQLAVEEGKLEFCRPRGPQEGPEAGDFSSQDPLQLVLGQDLLEFHPRVTSAGQVATVQVRSWDLLREQLLVGQAEPGPASAQLPLAPQDLAARFGASEYVLADRPLPDQAAVDAAARALAAQLASAASEALAVARGNPRLRAGAAVSIGVVAQPFVGQYVVTTARHILDADGYRVELGISGRLDRSLTQLTGGSGAAGRQPGLQVGIVTDNADPQGLGRVRVQLPALSNTYETGWAPVLAPGAGPQRGLCFLPEVNDQVVVGFWEGDPQHPFVLGGLWSANDPPPLGADAVDNGSVRRRELVSREGHRVVFLDGPHESGITLRTADGALQLALDARKREVTLRAPSVRITAEGELSLRTQGSLTVEAGGALTLKGQAGVTVASSGVVDVDGSLITLN